MQACILDADSLGPEVDLQAILDIPFQWTVWRSTKPEELAERVADAVVILTNKVVVHADIFAQARHLRFISVLATGTNNIDLRAAEKHGVAVSNVRDYSTDSVVQHTLSLMLALAGNLFSYQEDVRAGAWQTSPFFCYFNRPIAGLYGKTLSIVGYGNQGRKLARIASEMGMNIQILARAGGVGAGELPRKAWPELLASSDVLSFHCPLTRETENMLNADNIHLLKKSALVINCARGGLVHEQSIVQALEQGQLGGAAFDVVTSEPPPLDHPFMKVKHPNFILTPHIAWASIESRKLLVAATAKNLQGFLDGTLQNTIIP